MGGDTKDNDVTTRAGQVPEAVCTSEKQTTSKEYGSPRVAGRARGWTIDERPAAAIDARHTSRVEVRTALW